MAMGEAKRPGSRVLRTVMALLLVALLIPVTTPNNARADESSINSKDAEIAALLNAGEYVEGEVLVVVDNAVAQNGPRTRGVDILANAEPLMSVSGETYATVTGESLPLKETPANGPALLRSARALPTDNAVSIMLLKQGGGTSTEELLRQLQDDPRVLFAEPNYVYAISDPEHNIASALGLDPQAAPSGNQSGTTPAANDSNVADLSMYQWGCNNTGDTMVEEGEGFAPLKDFDINLPGWNTGAPNADGVVAVVDTGVDYNHPDLAGVMHDMTQYNLSRGGKYGFNALTEAVDPTDPMDDMFHGTHCAGIIAAEWNGEGTSGVASGVELVAVKVINKNNQMVQSDILAGYEYLAEAMDEGLPLKATNNSLGSPDITRSFSLAVTKLGEKGAISVFASGNDSVDLDKNAAIPSALVGNPYAVVVNASTSAGTLTVFSNYGKETTNVVAPGQAILSTVPLDKSAYLPEADKKPLSFDTFENENPTVNVYQFKSDDDPIGAVVKGVSRYDKAGGSLKVNIADMAEGPSGAFKEAVVTIPVDAGKQDDVTYVGMHLLTSPRKNDMAYMQFRIEKPSGTQDWTEPRPSVQTTVVECNRGWANLTANARSLAQQSGGKLAFTDDGKLQVKLTLGRQGSSFERDDVLYLDAVGVGKENAAAPYQLQNGTSMAAPMATGAAMVLAERTKANAPSSPADRAAALAALVKASVRPVDAFSDLCTSGGHVDLGLIPDQFTPVVSSAQVDSSTSPAHIIIGGSYFGNDEGTVTVAGKSAPVISWSDTSLTVKRPSTVKSGVLMIEVTAKNNQTGKRGFLLELPDTPEAAATPLYEKTIPLPSVEEGFSPYVLGGALAGLGGSLYMLPMDVSHSTGYFKQLWRYDPSGSWTRCADLPEALDTAASMTTHNGKLYLYAEKGADADASVHLMSYDPHVNSWESHPTANVPLHATIANCTGELLLIGGATFVPNAQGTGHWVNSDRNNISSYNPETGEVAAVGTLLFDVSTPTLTVHGSDIYIAQGYSFNEEGAILSNANLECVTKSDAGYASKDLTNTLPDPSPDRPQQPDMTSVKDGIILAGFVGTTDEDEDTYLLDIAHGGTEFKGIGKRASRSPLYNLSATAYDGWLYLLGFSSYEPDNQILRATAMETLPQAGDVVPKPKPSDKGEASAVARTGDARGGIATAVLVCTIAAATAGMAVATRRKKHVTTNRH